MLMQILKAIFIVFCVLQVKKSYNQFRNEVDINLPQ